MRFFIFFYSHTNGSAFGFGNIAITSQSFPSREALTKILIDSGKVPNPNISFTGFNEVTEADYSAWCDLPAS